ncbi:hypothetical protein EIP86_011436 [Pleurotus ostreatoroseus]|nr:hypothetical protein EIP86_011436 [Pleurotus ostreatoroseus]
MPPMGGGLYAAGSFSPCAPNSSNIALFAEDTGEPVQFLGFESEDDGSKNANARAGVSQVGTFFARPVISKYQRYRISQLMFNPMRPHLLYATFRRTDTIYCWDIRGDGASPVEAFDPHLHPRRATETSIILDEAASSPRASKVAATNQRRKFDIDISGSWLGVGSQEGDVSIFNLHGANYDISGFGSEVNIGPVLQFNAHDDAVGSVSFHSLAARLLSVSGSRHFEATPSGNSDDSDVSDEGNEEPANTQMGHTTLSVRKRTAKPSPVPRDTTVKLWDFAHPS